MARYTSAKQKIQRKVGEDLGLKTNAVKTAKRIMVRPGAHGAKMRRKMSGYNIQLREKQKVKSMYGLLEKQLRKLFEKASADPLNTGTVLLTLIERRLDNVVYRLQLAPTRAAARQMIVHNGLVVNDKKMNIPSYAVQEGDVIKLKDKATKVPVVAALLKNDNPTLPNWLNRKASIGKVVRLPDREDIKENIEEQLIVEYYNR